ncbi:M12 family metallopeptidase [Chitinophaga rhizosphaerae]|uniref:M12 family metallopeptidase n=1 Tax=Chitinophaga rhizosphaerae TaxID=1864947 RepID=UPI000F80CB34|nr:M12 family metallopeptidase [Chitinophaga rhizosphaerae]
MKTASVALAIGILFVLVACKGKPKTKLPDTVLSESDSLNALYKRPKDSIPPKIRWCTEIFPKADSTGLESLHVGALSIYRWKWVPGQPKQIRVCFNDGLPSIQDRVKAIAAEWERFTGAKFVYVPAGQNSDIKISFAKKGVSWSHIGTDSRNHNPSMNFGWLEEEQVDSLFASVVLHEFGHAIGLVHEHQLPDGNFIKWKVSAVYNYYLNYPNYWEVDDVKRNIFSRYMRDQLISGTFDPTSIMMYHIPPELTEDGYTTPINVRLSAEDKRLVSDVYRR